MKKQIRIILVDDHQAVRESWKFLLEKDERFTVIALCEDGRDAIEQAHRLLPDIMLMDINMKPVSGIEATRKLSEEYPAVKVIGVSFHTSPVYIKKMLDAGARGYVFKYAVVEDLMKAIEEVYKGNIFLGKGVMDGT